jgi:hypothetical protein
LKATTIIALDLFNDVTKTESIKSNRWFILVLGNNHLKQIMYNPENGAMILEDKHININQGAESTFVFFSD